MARRPSTRRSAAAMKSASVKQDPRSNQRAIGCLTISSREHCGTASCEPGSCGCNRWPRTQSLDCPGCGRSRGSLARRIDGPTKQLPPSVACKQRHSLKTGEGQLANVPQIFVVFDEFSVSGWHMHRANSRDGRCHQQPGLTGTTWLAQSTAGQASSGTRR